MRFNPIVLLFCAVLAIACRYGRAGEPLSKAAEKLVGKWKSTIGGAENPSTQTFQFNNNGTFSAEMTGVITRTYSGTWNVEGDQLVQTIVKVEGSGHIPDHPVKAKIKESATDHFVLQPNPDHPDRSVTFKREK
jgi:hypothetical protein